MITSKPKVMHLIYDEPVVVPVRGEDQEFRLRVWRARDCPAVALVSQVDGQKSPQIVSAKLANMVYRAYLGFLDLGMDYFESYGGRLYLVTFAWFGGEDRKRLVKPDRVEVPPSDIAILVGQAVEL